MLLIGPICLRYTISFIHRVLLHIMDIFHGLVSTLSASVCLSVALYHFGSLGRNVYLLAFSPKKLLSYGLLVFK